MSFVTILSGTQTSLQLPSLPPPSGMNQFIQQLITSSDVDLIIQTVKSSIKLNKHTQLLSSLNTFNQLKRNELTEVCQSNLSNIMLGIDELNLLSNDVVVLKGKLIGLNNINKEIISKLIKLQLHLDVLIITKDNLNLAGNCINDCLDLLYKFNMITTTYMNTKYYSCLKLILTEEFKLNYTFAKHIYQEINYFKEMIINHTNTDYNDWLLYLNNINIGKVLVNNNLCNQMNLVNEIYRWKDDSVDGIGLFTPLLGQSVSIQSAASVSIQSAAPLSIQSAEGNVHSASTLSLQSTNLPAKEDINKEDITKAKQSNLSKSLVQLVHNEINQTNHINNINFKPLYNSLLINKLLNTLFPKFQSTYSVDRCNHLHSLLANCPINSSPVTIQNVESFKNWFSSILGWFLIEHYIAKNTQVEFNDFKCLQLDREWSLAQTILKDSWENIIGNLDNVDCILDLKVWVAVGVNGLSSLNDLVRDLLPSLFSRYLNLIRKEGTKLVREILENDIYEPMTVNNNEEWQTVKLSMAGVLDSPEKIEAVVGSGASIPDLQNLTQISFPIRLPFTRGLPEVSLVMVKFIRAYHMFLDGVTQQFGEYDDLLLSALNTLLVQDVHGCILDRLKMESLGQTVQVWWNLAALSGLCGTVWEDWLDRRHGVTASDRFLGAEMVGLKIGTSRHALHLQRARKVFSETQSSAEKRVFEILNAKIDEFLELCDYDFRGSGRRGASLFLQDLLPWLHTTVSESLASFPTRIKWQVYFDCLNHLVQRLFGIMMDAEEMSVGFLDVWDEDLTFLELFCADLESGEDHLLGLRDALVEMRQTLNLLKSGVWEEYFNPSIKARKYSRVSKETVALLLEKYVFRLLLTFSFFRLGKNVGGMQSIISRFK
jgi:hypothetical protein